MKMIQSRPTVLFLIAILLAGCTTPHYVPPRSGDTAVLGITADIPYGTVMLSTYENGDTCTGEQVMIENESWSRLKKTKTRIPAGVAFSFRMLLLVPGASCNVVVTFDPMVGRTYEARIGHDTRRCHIQMLDTTGPIPRRERSARQRTWTPSMLTGNFCQPGEGSPLENQEATSDEKNGMSGVTMDDLKHLLSQP